MGSASGRAVDFYSRHPISAAHILATLRAQRGHLDGVRPDELFALDQDHYGGLAANDALAAAAKIGPGSAVVDFCAGLGGPARYYAVHHGATVTGVELTPARVVGARELTLLVGLEDRVRVVEGDVTRAPLGDACADAVLSQEALLHVPDKAKAVGEAVRILRPGGRLAFTDWILRRPIGAADRQALQDGIAAADIATAEDYRAMLAKAGFVDVSLVDLTTEWGPILAARFDMYTRLREDARNKGTPSGDEAFYRSYERLVALVRAGDLGGGRFSARKP